MIIVTKKWKSLFGGLCVLCAVLAAAGLLLHAIPLVLLSLLTAFVVAVFSIAKLRCPNCGKTVAYDAIRTRMDGEITCPKCEATFRIKVE